MAPEVGRTALVGNPFHEWCWHQTSHRKDREFGVGKETSGEIDPSKIHHPLTPSSTALVPARFTPFVPSEKTVVPSKKAADKSVPDKSIEEMSCPR